jgi:iron complex transport system substrate-binding protein
LRGIFFLSADLLQEGFSMKYKYPFLGLLLTAVLILGGCQAASPSVTTAVAVLTTVQFPLTFTDDAGRSVTLKAMPKRIVSLSPSNTEIVFALGLGDQLVGDTKYCNYPEAAKTKTQIGGFSDVDIEKVVSVQPDLILAANLHEPKVVPSLEQLNIPVMVLRPGTIEGIFKDINQLGAITGKSSEAKALTTDLQKRVSDLSAKTSNIKGAKPRVMYVTWHDPLYSAGDDTITGELIRIAGGENIAKEMSGYSTMTLETLIERNPQIIIVMSSMGDQVSTDYINSEPRLQATDALKNKKVYTVDSDLFGRTTPRIVDALEQLSKLVQPDLFK